MLGLMLQECPRPTKKILRPYLNSLKELAFTATLPTSPA